MDFIPKALIFLYKFSPCEVTPEEIEYEISIAISIFLPKAKPMSTYPLGGIS